MYAFDVFNYTLNMKIKEFPEDKLKKGFDELERIVYIEFLETNHKCYIDYFDDTTKKKSVIWNNGYSYTFDKEGNFTEAKAN